ncbi:hypothetical protein [Alicyclobacillus sp. ALC3]|uniref:hypothetical protein n=1 Tax=Alicyclobacillus sp. ALC3 TaxID=2796143 RepID=UPI00237A0302|nr:hypothetical protein [Alicyclobacillus sp. ALC3]WDL98463.1 hypothetical protein JC200_07205 [Alicyclobacillus sp. ALC3]
MIQLLIWIVISIIILFYVTTDAPKHEKSPFGWGIFAFFFNFLALGIYLYQTERRAPGLLWIVLWATIEFVYLLHGRLLL